MSHAYSTEVERLIQKRMASGRYASEDELLTEALQLLDEDDDDLRAIEESLAALDRGEVGVPLDEAFRRLRERHHLGDS